MLTLALACAPPLEDAQAPYGFAAAPSQRFRMESIERVDIDGAVAEIIRLAAFELRVTEAGEPQDLSVTHFDMYLDRY